MKNKKHSSSFYNKLLYMGSTSHIYKIWFLNIFLSIITFGVYSFWAKTRLRRYVMGSFSLMGDKLIYMGTGGELFWGFLKVLPFIVLIYSPLLFSENLILITISVFVMLFFFPVAMYSARRYKFSRIMWKGIRPKLSGSAIKFAVLYVWRIFLNIISLGLLIPSSDVRLSAYQMNQLSYGNLWFVYNASTRGLIGVNIITMLLAPFTLFMSRIWYRAALMRNKFDSLSIENVKFRFTATGWQLYKLIAVNGIILIFTLGLGKPILLQRYVRFFSEHLTIIGDLSALVVYQSEKEATALGEGMDVVFGIEPSLI